MEIICLPGERDVAFDVRLLKLQLARFDVKLPEQRGSYAGQHQSADGDEQDRCDGKPIGAHPDVCPGSERCNDRQADQQPQHGQLDMDVSVARADDHAIVAIEQQISVEAIGPGLHNEQETEQC